MRNKKTLVIIVTTITIGLIAIYLLVFNKRNASVLDAMPADVLCFFDVKANNEFSILLNSDEIFGAIGKTQLIGELQVDLNEYITLLATEPKLLSDLQQHNLIAGAFTSGKTSVDYLILLQLKEAKSFNLKNLHPELNGQAPNITKHIFERADIYELKYSNLNYNLSFSIVNGIFIYSTSAVLVENAILQLKKGTPVTENSGFNDVYDKMKSQEGYTFYMNVAQLADYFSLYAGNKAAASILQMQQYASWVGIQPEIKSNGILLNGYASARGKGETLALGSYTGQFATDMHESVPGNTVVLYRINAEQLSENIASKFKSEVTSRDYFDYWAPWISQHLLIGFSESLDKNFTARSYVIIPATDKKLATSKIKSAIVTDTLTYRDYQILELNCGEMIGAISGMQLPQYCFGAWSNNALIITVDKSQLTNMIDAIVNRTTLSADGDYNTFKQEVSASFNNSIYIDLSKSRQIIQYFVSDKHIDSVEANFGLLQQFSKLELQFSDNKDIYIVNGFIQFDADPKRKSGLLWNVSVDQPIAAGPFTIYNQSAEQEQIVVQDTAHQLYLISANGDVLWKRQLSSRIQSTIHEVDFYGNDKTQYLFNTANAIHLVDATGEPVEGFPISLTTTITNGIAVIKNTENDYSMYVACSNNNIYGYYKDGKPIAGWNPQKNSGNVTLPLFEFKSEKGKCIGFANASNIILRKTNGTKAASFTIKQSIISIFQSNNSLYAMDQIGAVISITNSLQSSQQPPGENFIAGLLTEISGIDTADVLVFEDKYIKARELSGNTIFILEPDPLFSGLVNTSFEGTNYFGYVTSANALYLYDAKGEMLPGFPVRGGKNIVVDDLTRSGDKMLITVDGNTVLAYRIQ